MLLADLAAFGMILDLFLVTSVTLLYGTTTLSGRALPREPRPVAWLGHQLGLLCVIFGLGLGIRDLAVIGPLLIALGYLLPSRMQSEPPPALDLALLGTAAFSLLALAALRWIV